MKRAAIVALACTNVALLLALMWGSAVPRVNAQEPGVFGKDYIMVTGLHPGTNTEALYILDVPRARLAALAYDTGKERLFAFGARNLKDDFKERGAQP
jgi:hypothetical protein